MAGILGGRTGRCRRLGWSEEWGVHAGWGL